MPKKHAPIEQLRAAGEEARRKLIERGVMTEENTVERLMKDRPKLVLPGMPSYIPHKWTIKASQRMMYDLLRMWQSKVSKTKDRRVEEMLPQFIEFSITEMKRQEDIAKKKMDSMPAIFKHLKEIPVIGKIFEPINHYETAKVMNKFFVDSFAVAIMVKGKKVSVSSFAEFFVDWTEELCTIWETKTSNELQDDKEKE